jgi:hypothetical protein
VLSHWARFNPLVGFELVQRVKCLGSAKYTILKYFRAIQNFTSIAGKVIIDQTENRGKTTPIALLLMSDKKCVNKCTVAIFQKIKIHISVGEVLIIVRSRVIIRPKSYCSSVSYISLVSFNVCERERRVGQV